MKKTDSNNLKDPNKKYIQIGGPEGYWIADPRESPYFINKLERARESMKNHPFPIALLRAK